MYGLTVTLKDPLLRQTIRLTLAQLEEDPAQAPRIHAQHLMRISNCFTAHATEALKRNNITAAGDAIQIAIRSNPANLSAQRLYANMLQAHLGKTDEAIATLQQGLALATPDNKELPDCIHHYFQLLDTQQRDAQILDEAKTWLLRQPPPTLRSTLAQYAATAAHNLGHYAEAIRHIEENKLDTPAAHILLARSQFYQGNYTTALKHLQNRQNEHTGPTRDAILSQRIRFHTELGQLDAALALTQERINEFPQNPQPRIHRLYLLEAAKHHEQLEKETTALIKDNAANPQPTLLLPLATYAAQRAHPDLANICYRHAIPPPPDPTPSQPRLRNPKLNHAIYASLLLESLIRDNRPKDALATYRDIVTTYRTLYSNDNEGTHHALLAAAHFALNDTGPARALLDRFLNDEKNDTQTLARIRELEIHRDGEYDKNGHCIQPATATTYDAKRTLTEAIKQLRHHPRKINPATYIAVAQLLRHVNAPTDALGILEKGLLAHPTHSQLKADTIATRILCKQTQRYGTRKDLPAEITELLALRRPNPAIWTQILHWTDTDTTCPPEQIAALRTLITPLARPELTGLNLFN
ncbi:MAG: hypothetical protein LBD14_03115 [Puniceicoccales bacterium]|jgi:tetratricopeptide (TPR) repeat protein|nr:hypothetical protein [Puniceicoccales bacterium]